MVWRASSIWSLYSGNAATPRFCASCMKISRSTTSSFSWARTSSVTGRPDAATCLASTSTRAVGTALPLTMATFCAAAQGAAARRTAAVRADRENFMVFLG
ncbi:hypothetical protein D9M68_848210 [compost metagenome]